MGQNAPQIPQQDFDFLQAMHDLDCVKQAVLSWLTHNPFSAVAHDISLFCSSEVYNKDMLECCEALWGRARIQGLVEALQLCVATGVRTRFRASRTTLPSTLEPEGFVETSGFPPQLRPSSGSLPTVCHGSPGISIVASLSPGTSACALLTSPGRLLICNAVLPADRHEKQNHRNVQGHLSEGLHKL